MGGDREYDGRAGGGDGAVLFLRGAQMSFSGGGSEFMIPEPKNMLPYPLKKDHVTTDHRTEHVWRCCTCCGDGFSTPRVHPEEVDLTEDITVVTAESTESRESRDSIPGDAA